MSIALLAVSVDAVDAARLANFWAQALQRTSTTGPLKTSRRSPPIPTASGDPS